MGYMYAVDGPGGLRPYTMACSITSSCATLSLSHFFFLTKLPFSVFCFIKMVILPLGSPPASGPEMSTPGMRVGRLKRELWPLPRYRSQHALLSTTAAACAAFACKQMSRSSTERQSVILEHKWSHCRWHHRCAYRFQPPLPPTHTHLGAGSWCPWGFAMWSLPLQCHF